MSERLSKAVTLTAVLVDWVASNPGAIYGLKKLTKSVCYAFISPCLYNDFGLERYAAPQEIVDVCAEVE